MIPLIFQNSYVDRLGIAYGGGGGGNSGAIAFPTHMEEIHQDWLGYSGSPTAVTTDLISVINSAIVNNPLETLAYDDPATNIAEINTEYDGWNTLVDALDEHTDIDTIINNAVVQVDTAGVLVDTDVASLITSARTGAGTTVSDVVDSALAAIDQGLLNQAVSQYVQARRREREQIRTQFKAGAVNLGMTRSSAYALGLALLELDFERETSQYETELSLNMYQQGFEMYYRAFSEELAATLKGALLDKTTRDNFMQFTTQQMLTYKQFVVDMTKQLSTVLAQLHQTGFVMDSEYVGNTADLNWKYSSWDFEVFNNAINVLGGIGGGSVTPPKPPSKAASVLGGVLSGAGVGAGLGPGGAVVGGVIGGLAGLF